MLVKTIAFFYGNENHIILFLIARVKLFIPLDTEVLKIIYPNFPPESNDDCFDFIKDNNLYSPIYEFGEKIHEDWNKNKKEGKTYNNTSFDLTDADFISQKKFSNTTELYGFIECCKNQYLNADGSKITSEDENEDTEQEFIHIPFVIIFKNGHEEINLDNFMDNITFAVHSGYAL